MNARVTRFEGSPSDLDKGIKLIKDTIMPSAKKMSGFKNGYWFIDRASGKGMAVTLFDNYVFYPPTPPLDNEASMRGSETAAEESRAQATQAGFRMIGVERYEVVAQT